MLFFSVCTTALDVLSALTQIPNEINALDKVRKRRASKKRERKRGGERRDEERSRVERNRKKN